jgi:hypothetical protein
MRVDINRQLASIFPPDGEKPALAQMNSALGKEFKLKGAKGSIELVKE